VELPPIWILRDPMPDMKIAGCCFQFYDVLLLLDMESTPT